MKEPCEGSLRMLPYMPACEVWRPGHLGVFPLISLKNPGTPQFFFKTPIFFKNPNIVLNPSKKRTLFLGKTDTLYSGHECTKMRNMKSACTCKLILLASTHVWCTSTCVHMTYMYVTQKSEGVNKKLHLSSRSDLPENCIYRVGQIYQQHEHTLHGLSHAQPVVTCSTSSAVRSKFSMSACTLHTMQMHEVHQDSRDISPTSLATGTEPQIPGLSGTVGKYVHLFCCLSTYCVAVVDFCEPSPCENGGTCTSTDSVGFTCRCPQDFNGERCEEGSTVNAPRNAYCYSRCAV